MSRLLFPWCCPTAQVVTSTNSKKLSRRDKYHCTFFIKTATLGGGLFILNAYFADLIDICLEATNQFCIFYIKWIRVILVVKEVIH